MSTMINREKLEGKSPESSIDDFTKQVVEEANNEIKYRTLSWQKATLLLFGEYVCLAILSLSWSWSVIGWVSHRSGPVLASFVNTAPDIGQVGGALLTFGLGLLTACKSEPHGPTPLHARGFQSDVRSVFCAVLSAHKQTIAIRCGSSV